MKVCFFLLLCVLLPLPCRAQRSCVIVLLPGTSLRDWQATAAPNLHRLMAQGALAVMNTRTARLGSDKRRESPESACLTLAAGSRAVGDADDLLFSSAAALYQRRTGDIAPPGRLVNVDLPLLLAKNEGRGYAIRLGNLSEALKKAGVSVTAGGGRYALPVAMDSSGTVALTSSLTVKVNTCLIWDGGSDIQAADTVIGALAQRADLLLVVSPFAGNRAYHNGERLTPILVEGSGIAPGLLYSSSTRRAGLITNTDFAPSVAQYFGATLPTQPYGHPWTVQPSRHAVVVVAHLESAAYAQDRGMRLLPYLAILLALWLLIPPLLRVRGHVLEWCPLPPLVLLLALLLSISITTFLLWLPALAFAAYFLSRLIGAARVLGLLLLLLPSVIIGDLATGSQLLRGSLLGYSATEGARYYGIGNEGMGLLIGALVVIAGRFWPSANLWQRTGLVISLFLVTVLLGSPAAGAKAGGLLVALISFGTLLFRLTGRHIKAWQIGVLGLGVVSVMSLVALADAHLGTGHRSHIGDELVRIQGGGLADAADIVRRKLSVELFLLTHSAWAALLFSGLGSAWHLWRRQGSNLAIQSAGMAAVASCLALNDAGVVAAALCLIPLWCDAYSTK